MPERIEVRDFENQSFSVVLGGQRYRIGLRYNPTCDIWMVSVSQNGELVVQGVPLVKNGLILSGLSCLPASFGGLYLEVKDSNVTGSQALISGAQCLWFYTSQEVYALYGTVNP